MIIQINQYMSIKVIKVCALLFSQPPQHPLLSYLGHFLI